MGGKKDIMGGKEKYNEVGKKILKELKICIIILIIYLNI